MLVSKNWDTSLRASEKKTLLSFLLLYSFLTLLILIFIAILYYNSQKELLLQNKREYLSALTGEQITRLKTLHATFDLNQTYPRDERFNSAIYDSSLKEIFSTLISKNVNLYEDIYLKDNHIYFIKELEQYYLGTRYIALEIPAPPTWQTQVYKQLLIYGSVLFLVLVIIGYFLLSLLLKPMRQAIALLDRFIKDTTHELNTPINTILSNIEMIDTNSLDKGLERKISRITIASKTISNLYDDLTYLVLSHRINSTNEPVELIPLINERLEYFSLLMEAKKISFTFVYHTNASLVIDRKKMIKLVDNILSNAIKYNKIGGEIIITLNENNLVIKDTGVGIEEEKLTRVFERYLRLNNTVGGFGIGLNIVAMIAKEYDLTVTITSILHQQTEVTVAW